jgi:hypothetical protein
MSRGRSELANGVERRGREGGRKRKPSPLHHEFRIEVESLMFRTLYEK